MSAPGALSRLLVIEDGLQLREDYLLRRGHRGQLSLDVGELLLRSFFRLADMVRLGGVLVLRERFS